MVKILVLGILVCLFTTNSYAGKLDFTDNGDYITDNISGSDWYKVSLTVNMSYEEVSNLLMKPGSLLNGYRYASKEEFAMLVGNWTDNDIESVWGGIEMTYAHNGLPELLGPTGTKITRIPEDLGPQFEGHPLAFDIISSEVYGMLSDTNLNGEHLRSDLTSKVFISYDESIEFNVDSLTGRLILGGPGDLAVGVTEKEAWFGSFLVRDNAISPIPIPASFWLFSSGLIGVISFFRKK